MSFSSGSWPSVVLGPWDKEFPHCVPRARERRSREPVKMLFHFHVGSAWGANSFAFFIACRAHSSAVSPRGLLARNASLEDLHVVHSFKFAASGKNLARRKVNRAAIHIHYH